jgi:hypothetical protein
MDHQPCHKRPELRGREDVDFEHPHGVWADGSVVHGVDA